MDTHTLESLEIPEEIVNSLMKFSPERREQVFDFVRFLAQQHQGEVIVKRRAPHPDIVGKVQILGNIIDTIPETEWHLP
jgi:hypothetical protein